jgi:hypothetical protein
MPTLLLQLQLLPLLLLLNTARYETTTVMCCWH